MASSNLENAQDYALMAFDSYFRGDDPKIEAFPEGARRKVLSRPYLSCDRRHFHASLTF
ncbi:hypothetical protein [Cohaesibacter haloalkalitolerans]|uniref:hypothetical protein n=1 Tax=Cohaesibacter haloalkalitolerans TaxID=1162980 RepID=UPI0013C3F3DD|nr:hypothetical protein [Cohaesibacter haloalkalitolerans]